MITEALANWSQSKGYRTVHCDDHDFDAVEKQVGDYRFSVSYETSQQSEALMGALFGLLGSLIASKSYHVKMAVDDGTWGKEVLKDLRNELSEWAVPAYTKGCLSIRLKKSKDADETLALFDDIAETAARYLFQAGVRMPEECHICEKAACDSAALQVSANTVLHPAHAACIEGSEWLSLTKLRIQAQKEGYALAIVAALGGAILGAIPTGLLFFVDIYGSFINLLGYLLIPIVAFFCYRSANGKAGPIAIPFVLLYTTVIITVLVVIGDYLFFVYDFFGAEIEATMGEYLGFVLDYPEYLSTVVFETLLSWVFGIGGTAIGYVQLRKQRKKEKSRLEALTLQYERTAQ